MAHLHGDRDRADQLYQQALSVGQERARVSGQSTSLLRSYGAALAREGRAAEAVPILERALQETVLHVHDEQNLRRTRGMLGDAYDQLGRTEDARTLLMQAREDWMRYGPVDGNLALGARERWARFLLDHGQADAAAAEYQAVLGLAHGTAMAPAARAQAGLARLALARGALHEADLASAAALKCIDGVTLEHDVRARVDIGVARAQVLAAMGRSEAARAMARESADNAALWDAEGSAQLARARAVVAVVK